MSWHGQARRVSVLAEMALRQEKVSERLLELRERQGLSQEDAARKVGITHRQWQRWETGASMPYPRNLDAVASAFGIGVAEFFDPDLPMVDVSQLDRIEAKLDEVLAHLHAGVAGDVVETLVSGALPEVQRPAAASTGRGSAKRAGAKKAAPAKARAPRKRQAG